MNDSSTTMEATSAGQLSREQIERRVRELGQWFHNLDLRGVRTAPDHFLGDYPAFKWRMFESHIPADLTGKSVLDIGCNAGFYSLEMKKRGADRVLAIDYDDDYLAQARFAAQVSGLDIEFRKLSVYDVASIGETFDVVLFMGVLYHLRHPLLALDLIHDHVARDLLVYQSMQRGSNEVEPLRNDYDFRETEIFEKPGFPRMYFIEKKYSKDPTNWWVPNRACSEAMLRSSGFEILSHPEDEVFVCKWLDIPEGDLGPRAVYPARPVRPSSPRAEDRHG
ncbi:MAG TPA: TIGR04290 family methyltransferase [Tepidisphaeraceae bacterium]|nr:TIGR04290 family methyltransferase [Tepidisphaeraceae bacterium]